MDKRKIPARFEKSNVIDPHNPAFDIVSQENEIIAIKQISWLVSLTHGIESRQPLRFFPECHYKGRVIAGIDWEIALRNRYTNSSSLQSGENLIDPYGRERCMNQRCDMETEATNSIAVPRAPGVSHDCDSLQRCRYGARVEASAPPDVRLAPIDRSNDCPCPCAVDERYEIILPDSRFLKDLHRERRA